ncbi:MAG TPA: TetR/AcrR family transcriptional regulator [Gemmatimonadales bacterium]|nr:TetR/AcrR family transcriptional regulator [Gemmatimonadales bacterium]
MVTAIDRLGKLSQREDTRRKILASAEQVFAEKGFYRSVVDDIVKASGTSKGAVYFYFSSKEEIFLSLVEDYAATVAQELQIAVQHGRGLLAHVEAAVATLVRNFQAHRALAKIVLVDWPAAGAEFQGKRIALKGMLVEVLRGYLDRAVEDGKIPAQDTEMAAYVWIGAISEVVVRWLNTGKPDPLDDVLAPLTRLLLSSVGLAVPAEAPR